MISECFKALPEKFIDFFYIFNFFVEYVLLLNFGQISAALFQNVDQVLVDREISVHIWQLNVI